MCGYHAWWRAKPYSWIVLNETIAQGAVFGLCAALSLGPLSRLCPGMFGSVLGLRRTFGVNGAIFAVVHIFVALVLLWGTFGWKYISEHILMVCLGACTALILFMLAVLSFKSMLERVGAERWLRIQKLGYLAVVLACAHFMVLGKITGWVEWFQTMNRPAPPGSLPVCILGCIPFVLKLVEWARTRKGAGTNEREGGTATAA